MNLSTPEKKFGPALLLVLLSASVALGAPAAPPAPVAEPPKVIYPPLSIPAPGPVTAGAYAPQPILPGGIVLPLYAPDSPQLKRERIAEAEHYNMSAGTPGRIQSIINIHNPSIEVHTVDAGIRNGTAVILVAGGGHRTLNVGTEGGDFVPYFYNYGVTTIILRNRLRSDGYEPKTHGVNDALQAIRLVRAHAAEWGIDPARIGIVGFSAGAELAASAGVFYGKFAGTTRDPSDPLAGTSARPDFVGLVYPGPTPFTPDPATPVPADAPPTFIVSGGSGDRQHAIWADQYFAAMLNAGVPNLEMHIYGNGVHAGGMLDRGGIPFGTWQDRYIDWFRDLGFLGKAGTETKAARDVTAFVKKAAEAPADPFWPASGVFEAKGRTSSWSGFRAKNVERRTLFAQRRAQDQDAIVFVGDSITEGWHTLEADFADLPVKVANRGIGGDTTPNLLYRLQDDILSLHPRALVITIGTNDLGEHTPPADIAANLRVLHARIRADYPKIPIAWCLVMPRKGDDTYPQRIHELNDLIAQLARTDPLVTLCDTFTPLALEDGSSKAEDFVPDHLHLNANGYAVWRTALHPILAGWKLEAK